MPTRRRPLESARVEGPFRKSQFFRLWNWSVFYGGESFALPISRTIPFAKRRALNCGNSAYTSNEFRT